MKMSVSQKKFQEWFKDHFGVDKTWFAKDRKGCYVYETVEIAFISWKASEENCLTIKKES